jgi:alcohol dehydrogenase class IV/Fe-S-cluster-containing hydrogenase component 2
VFLSVAWYRTFQAVFNLGARVLPWRKAKPVAGAGAIKRIPELLGGLGVAKPMVVTDQGLMKAGIAPKILAVLDGAGVPYSLYNRVEPNPTVAVVNEIFSQYRADGCSGFVAIGGGSPMDAAKAAAARAVFPKKTVNQLGGLLRVWKKIPPFIAVPTTAGTGSETTIAALITDQATHHKYAIMDLHLIPRYAILDPELITGLPPAITAATGLDALTHAVEAYLCWTYNTTDSINCALDAVKAIFANLEKTYNNGGDLDARLAMLEASYKAGFAFTRAGVGNVHAIAHTLGGLYNTPHGLANAVILPVVLEDYGPAVHRKLARLAVQAGVAKPGAGAAENARAFIDAIYGLNKRMKIPSGFDFIKDEDIPQMIAWAKKEANPLYPVPVVYDSKRFREVIGRIRLRPSFRITDDCKGCTACAKACPVFAITGERGQVHTIDPARCVACGVCGRICQFGAVTGADGRQAAPVRRSEWHRPVIDREACSACGICVNVCTAGALAISAPAFRGDIRVFAELAEPGKCVACGLCERKCPIGAVRMGGGS